MFKSVFVQFQSFDCPQEKQGVPHNPMLTSDWQAKWESAVDPEIKVTLKGLLDIVQRLCFIGVRCFARLLCRSVFGALAEIVV
jgi:hypothetical protein